MERQIQLLDKVMRYIIYILFFLIVAAKCDSPGNSIEGIRLSDSYTDCEYEYYDFGETITLSDHYEKFMITLPYSWAIREALSDTLYGIIASNSFDEESDPEEFILITVTAYQTDDSLAGYIRNEIKTLKKDKNIKVIEAGKSTINELSSWWVRFENIENEFTIMNLVQYVKQTDRNEVYLIQASVFGNDEAEKKFCRLKRFLDSFELMEE